MRRLRAGLTYSNVMATIAVFIALGGGAYALSRNEVKSRNIAPDAVKAKHIDFGVRSTPMMANFSGLENGSGSFAYSPTGPSSTGTGLAHESISPQAFVATGLRVRLGNPLATGTRDFIFRYEPREGGASTPLRCQITAGERECQSNARVRVPAGVDVYFRHEHVAANDGVYAEVGWRAVLP
jgi:hypothetical protein